MLQPVAPIVQSKALIETIIASADSKSINKRKKAKSPYLRGGMGYSPKKPKYLNNIEPQTLQLVTDDRGGVSGTFLSPSNINIQVPIATKVYK